MTTKDDFDEQEWARIVRAPFVAGMAITLADPGGPIEATKESMASMKSATNPPSREQLLSEVALDIQASVQQRHNPLKGYKPGAGSRRASRCSTSCARCKSSCGPRPIRRRLPRSPAGSSSRHRQQPTRPRRAASWASGPSR